MIILGTNSIKATGFDVANSLRFNKGDDPELSRSTGDGNERIGMFSFWTKTDDEGVIYEITTDSNNFFDISVDGSRQLQVRNKLSGSYNMELLLTRQFRDPSAWTHFFIAIDTTQGTSSNRVKIFINGVQDTTFNTSTYPSQNDDLFMNANSKTAKISGTSGVRFNGYLAEFVLIDGTVKAVTDFGEFDSDSGIWKPINVSGLSGDKGVNGFYLDFEDSSALGNCAFGGTDFTVSNLAAIDQSTDTCTNNFATGNPLDNGCGKAPTFSEGNLKYVSSSTFNFALPTIGVSSGKWYMEIKYSALGSGGSIMAGITDQFDNTNRDLTGNAFAGGEPLGIGYYQNGNKYLNNVASSYGSTYTTGDIIGVYLDVDNSKLYFAKNGTLQNSGTGLDLPSSANSTGVFFFMPSVDKATIEVNYGNPTFTGTDKADANGYGSFEYDPSVGTFDGASKDFYALCTKNLAEYG